MRSFTDQMGNEISISFPPRRIISLVPSQTELLADLGLDDEVVGITRFCVHPEGWIARKVNVGGTKNFDLKKIQTLDPDLIIGNREENTEEGINALQQSFPVWMSDVISLADALNMIRGVGEITDRKSEGGRYAEEIRQRFSLFTPNLTPRKVLYLIWKKPWMAAGRATFIGHMLDVIGWQNVLDEGTRYPELTTTQIAALDPDLILLSSEPYPFKHIHEEELLAICPRAQVTRVDGEMFSWYGTRLRKAPDYFSTLTLVRR